MAGGTSWMLGALSLFLFVAALSALPTPEPTSEAINEVEDTTLSTELRPPPPPEKEEHQYMIFVINLYGIRNSTSETSEEMFENELVQKFPELTEPLATVLLVLEVDENDEDSDVPVDLDDVADELENDEGFMVEKINHAGETKMLRVKLDKSNAESIGLSKGKPEMTNKLRNKRSYCVKCGGGGGYSSYGGGGYPYGTGPSGGGCGGGGCGGGGYPSGGGGYPGGGGGYPSGGGGYPGGGGGYPSGGGGYPIGGGGGHYPGGGYPTGGGGGGGCATCGGGGKASASATAQAQANAGGWGK